MTQRGVFITSRCTTIEDFVTKYHRDCDETSLFIRTRSTRAVGSEWPFAIHLADGRGVVLEGWCVVFDSFKDAANQFRQPGLRLGLHRLTPDSKRVMERMQVARGIKIEPPPRATVSTPKLMLMPAPGRPERRVTIRIPALTLAPAIDSRPPLSPPPLFESQPVPRIVLAEGSQNTVAALRNDDDIAPIVSRPPELANPQPAAIQIPVAAPDALRIYRIAFFAALLALAYAVGFATARMI